ncbi:MAG: hypothetical protein NTX71_02505 [Candidatus Aureabacteria bacterium]|nr:hypothetical protein [Candidatus Auribacterota bacterium]
MILFFDPFPPLLRWCKAEDRVFLEHRCTYGPQLAEEVTHNVGDIGRIRAIGYLLYNGGGEITAPASLLSRDILVSVERCIWLLPEHNDLTLKIASYWIDKLPAIPHILFCDTAFFNNLPDEVSTYAVPYELRKKGMQRYGGYGLFHQWAWKKTQAIPGAHSRKLLSVYLGDHTNIAAIHDGMPLETTFGFTSLEGIPSSTGCGDIDPTIVLQLHSSGMSLEEINRLLSNESGLSGLMGERCDFLNLVRDSDPKRAVVRDILRYNILKYTGAFISILGGVDSIAFLSENMRESLSFIREICHGLEFLGLKLNVIQNENSSFLHLSSGDSRVDVFCMQCNKWEVLLEEAERLLNNEV